MTDIENTQGTHDAQDRPVDESTGSDPQHFDEERMPTTGGELSDPDAAPASDPHGRVLCWASRAAARVMARSWSRAISRRGSVGSVAM